MSETRLTGQRQLTREKLDLNELAFADDRSALIVNYESDRWPFCQTGLVDSVYCTTRDRDDFVGSSSNK